MAVIDGTANDGYHTTQFLKTFPNATVYIFEPDERAQKKLHARGLLNDSRVKFSGLAIGAEDGVTEFYVSSGWRPTFSDAEKAYYREGWDASGSIRPPTQICHEKWPWLKFDNKKMVRIAKLDTWAEQTGVGNVDFIWADVQGAEVDLVNGAQNVLKRTRYFFTEYGNEEWYKGQINLEKLSSMLPDFEVDKLYTSDVLYKKRSLIL